MWNNNKFDIVSIGKDTIEEAGDLLEKGHGMVDTLSEYSPYVKVVNSLINKRIELKCKQFLQGLAIKVFSREELTSDDLQKLNELIMKDKNMDLILNILEEATNTVSYTSSKILGVIAGQVMEGQREFDYTDWTLVNGLKNMNDWDIKNFKKVYLYFKSYPEEININTLCLFLNINTKEYGVIRKEAIETSDHTKQLKIMNKNEYKMLKSSLRRLMNLQILNTGSVLSDIDDMSFERSEVGNELYKLIKLVDIE